MTQPADASPPAPAEIPWHHLVEETSDESALSASFLTLLVISCLIAGAGVITESPVTIVGAMVVCPDFGPLAALAVGAVGRRRDLVRRGLLALLVGYPLAVAVTFLAGLVLEATGLLDPAALDDLGAVSFVYQVGPYSAMVALLAGVAGMTALVSAKSGALIGVFISVTTIPAAGCAALSATAGDWGRCGASLAQLGVNLAGVALAGTVTLWVARERAREQLSAAGRPAREA